MTNSLLSIFADDQYSAFLNGEPIAENANSWWQAEADQIPLQLSPGDYVLAVRVVDGHIRGGLAAAITRDTSSLLTTGGWRASSEEQAEWNTLSFDDSSWVYAQDMGYGWAEDYHGKSVDISANGNQAKWIWHPDFDHQQTTIYFRKTFTVDDQGLIVPPANIAPVASIQQRVFAQGLILNVGENFNSLFEVNDPDQDIITTYTFTTKSQTEEEGYFQRIEGESRERITTSEFSISATELNQLEWVAGQPGKTNRIGVRATDSRGGSSSSTEAVPWSTGNSRLAIVVDNSYKAWLNGELLGENPWSFGSPTDFFDLNLQPGTHVLAIEASDAGGPAAVIAALTLEANSLTTTRSWKITTEETEGWQTLDFDDSAWGYAREYDSGTWDFGLSRVDFLVPTAKWIWDDNLYDTDKAYLRVKFEIGANGQLIQPPAPPNKAPIVTVQPWNFNPDEIVNIGTAFESLFSVSDPDGDPIVEYEFFDNNLSDVSGNFYRISTNERYTTNQFSIKAEDLHDLEWRAGITNSIDGIRLKATDQYGATNEWQAENAIWRSRRRLSINSPVVNEGELITFTLSRFDQIDQPLRLWLQVDSGLDKVQIENTQIHELLNSGKRIPLDFNGGVSTLDLNYFRTRFNNAAETESYPVLDISIFSDQQGGSTLIGSLAKAIDVNRPPAGRPRPSDKVELKSSKLNQTLKLSELLAYYQFDDPDGDEITHFIFSQTSSDSSTGYWQQPNEGQAFSNFTTPALTRQELESHTYTFLGGNRSSQTISVRAGDARGAFSEPMSLTFNVHQAPDVRLSSPGFSWTLEGVAQPFKDWLSIGTDPDGDQIKFFAIADRTVDPISGYFMLDGKKLYADPHKHYLVSPEEINRLMWIPGNKGTQDTIEVAYQDSIGDGGSVTATFSTGRGPTGYVISNQSGYNHVTEGDTFSLDIQKLANYDRNTTLKWAIFGPSSAHNLNGGRTDFKSIPQGWNTLTFNANSRRNTAVLDLNTLKDTNEGSETARIWFYNEEKNFGDRSKLLDGTELLKLDEGQLKNLGYSFLDVGIHDNIFYAMDMSATKVEGERSSMTVARFGGGKTRSTVYLKTQTIQELYPDPMAYKSLKGLATAGQDFISQNEKLSFTKDSIFGVETLLKADNITENGGEVFAWALYSDAKKPDRLDTRLVTILDEKNSFRLQSFNTQAAWDFFGAVGGTVSGFFANIGASIGRGLQSVDSFLKTLANSNKPVASLPESQLLLIKTGNGLVGAQAGALIAQGGGNLTNEIIKGLIAQGGGNLIAQGGGNLSEGIIKDIEANGGRNLIAQGGGNLIRTAVNTLVAEGVGSLVAQGGANLNELIVEKLIAQGGGNLTNEIIIKGLIAQGGGNFNRAVDKLIAQNLVTQGGGNLAATISRLVAQGGANLVTQGGGNLGARIDALILQEGANLIRQGGAQLLANEIAYAVLGQGGANVIIQNGANLGSSIPIGFSRSDTLAIPDNSEMYQSFDRGMIISDNAFGRISQLRDINKDPLLGTGNPI